MNEEIIAIILTKDKVINDLPCELREWVTCWNHEGFFVLGRSGQFPWGTICCIGEGIPEFITSEEAEKIIIKAKAVAKVLEEAYHDFAKRSFLTPE